MLILYQTKQNCRAFGERKRERSVNQVTVVRRRREEGRVAFRKSTCQRVVCEGESLSGRGLSNLLEESTKLVEDTGNE